jgi:hypothetical protein
MGTQEQAERELEKYSKEEYYKILDNQVSNRIFLEFLKKPNTQALVSKAIYPKTINSEITKTYSKKKPKKPKPIPTVCLKTAIFEKLGWLVAEEYKVITHRKNNKPYPQKRDGYVATIKPLFDYLEFTQRIKLKKQDKYFLESLFSKEFVINHIVNTEYTFIKGCIAILREYLLFRKFIQIFEKVFIKFNVQEVLSHYTSILEKNDQNYDTNIYSAYFTIYANEKEFWDEKLENVKFWDKLEKIVFNNKSDSKDFEGLIISMSKNVDEAER